MGFGVGFPVDEDVRRAISLVPEDVWEPATEDDGEIRPGAFLAEFTRMVDLSAWPEDSRVVCRRERPHPGAALTLLEAQDGRRYTAFVTDRPWRPRRRDRRPPLRQCRHAGLEDRIRQSKTTGLKNFPCQDVAKNNAWMECPWPPPTSSVGPSSSALPSSRSSRTVRSRLSVMPSCTWPHGSPARPGQSTCASTGLGHGPGYWRRQFPACGPPSADHPALYRGHEKPARLVRATMLPRPAPTATRRPLWTGDAAAPGASRHGRRSWGKDHDFVSPRDGHPHVCLKDRG